MCGTEDCSRFGRGGHVGSIAGSNSGSARVVTEADTANPNMDPEGIDLEGWHRWWKTSGARELRGLLMKYWDPIGVNGIPEASDEYDLYLGPLAKKLREGADARGVSEYLSEIQSQRMEIPARPDQLTDVGERVVGGMALRWSPEPAQRSPRLVQSTTQPGNETICLVRLGDIRSGLKRGREERRGCSPRASASSPGATQDSSSG